MKIQVIIDGVLLFMEKLSYRLARIRVEENGDPQNLEWYRYKIELRLGQFVTYGTMLLLAILTGRVLEGALFLLFLLPLRKAAGGYHAQSHLLCYVSSIGCYFIGVHALPLLQQQWSPLSAIFVLTGCVIVLALAPVIHPNLPQSGKQKDRLRLISILILMAQVVVVIVLTLLRVPEVYTGVSCNGILVSSILLLVAKITKQEGKVSDEKV